MKPSLYLFNWPDAVGGAGTKVAHLLLLLHDTFRVTVVPNEAARLTDGKWGRFLKRLGVHACTRRELPRRLEGWGVSLCNGHFLRSGLAAEMKRRGLKLAWGSEMMWHHSGERALVMGGLVDLVLYTGPEQRAALLPGYTADGALPEPRGAVVGNYIHAPCFPYAERTRTELAAGRISRADPAKFPAGFPLTYHGLGLRRGRCRVLGWSPQVAARWPWYDFASARITAEPPPEARAAEWGFGGQAASLPRPRWQLHAPGAVERYAFSIAWTFTSMMSAPALARAGAARWWRPCSRGCPSCCRRTRGTICTGWCLTRWRAGTARSRRSGGRRRSVCPAMPPCAAAWAGRVPAMPGTSCAMRAGTGEFGRRRWRGEDAASLAPAPMKIFRRAGRGAFQGGVP